MVPAITFCYTGTLSSSLARLRSFISDQRLLTVLNDGKQGTKLPDILMNLFINPNEITTEQFLASLGVLPPDDWVHDPDNESFKLEEMFYG